MLSAEMSDIKRHLYRGASGLLPGVLAIYLSQNINSFISTVATFLAPPFIIIFPGIHFSTQILIQNLALMYIKMHRYQMTKTNTGSYVFAWVFLIVLGVGSYVSEFINVWKGDLGGV
jgi:hypothetical protein